MSDYYAVLVNLPNAPKGNAHLDVSIDGSLTAGQPVPVTYETCSERPTQVPLAKAQVSTANNYASNNMAAAPNNNLLRGVGPAERARACADADPPGRVVVQRGTSSRRCRARARSSSGSPADAQLRTARRSRAGRASRLPSVTS